MSNDPDDEGYIIPDYIFDDTIVLDTPSPSGYRVEASFAEESVRISEYTARGVKRIALTAHEMYNLVKRWQQIHDEYEESKNE